MRISFVCAYVAYTFFYSLHIDWSLYVDRVSLAIYFTQK